MSPYSFQICFQQKTSGEDSTSLPPDVRHRHRLRHRHRQSSTLGRQSSARPSDSEPIQRTYMESNMNANENRVQIIHESTSTSTSIELVKKANVAVDQASSEFIGSCNRIVIRVQIYNPHFPKSSSIQFFRFRFGLIDRVSSVLQEWNRQLK